MIIFLISSRPAEGSCNDGQFWRVFMTEVVGEVA